MTPVATLIGDVVGSRSAADRRGLHARLEEVIATINATTDPVHPVRITVGDEFQVIAPDLGAALDLTLRVSLLLPEGLRLRFGLGLGEIREVDPDAEDVVQDGAAWWAARDAIEAAHALQDSGRDFALTQLRVADGPEDAASRQSLANAMLLLRDQTVSRLQARQRRVLGALLLGRTQVDVAREERLSQQAVSALARGAGAGILAAQELLAAVGRDGESGRRDERAGDGVEDRRSTSGRKERVR